MIWIAVRHGIVVGTGASPCRAVMAAYVAAVLAGVLELDLDAASAWVDELVVVEG